MYPIDFLTCSAVDVIKRSIVCHPSLFADKIAAARDMHAAYSRETTNQQAAASARAMSGDCAGIIAAIAEENAERIVSDTSRLVIAFQAAADLQLVPRACRADILARA
jgi:hypothetical protein